MKLSINCLSGLFCSNHFGINFILEVQWRARNGAFLPRCLSIASCLPPKGTG
jgi:hypothetical protein